MIHANTTIAALLERYEGLLFDAYGVLLDASGARADARELVERLNNTQYPYAIVTNSASKTLDRTWHWYNDIGLAIPRERIITTGSLIPRYFEEHQLQGRRCAVLGPGDSVAMVEQAQGVVVSPLAEDFDVLVVADESGYPFIATLDAILTRICKTIEAGRFLHLLLANPDHLYPKDSETKGIAAGSVMSLIEAALSSLYGSSAPRFECLGKPYRLIFDIACEQIGVHRVAMIGDQMATDIKGAHAAGLDSVLFRVNPSSVAFRGWNDIRPTWLLDSLAL